MIFTPNILSYLALLLWAPIAIGVFYRIREPVRASAWLMLSAAMFLPEWVNFDPPLLPPFDKNSMGALFVLVGCMLMASWKLSAARPFRGVDLLFVVACVGLIGTSLTNGDDQVFGPTHIQGLTLYDCFAQTVKDVMSIYLPFFIGRAMFRTSKDLRTFMRVFVSAGLVYSVLILWEARFSPQLHRTFYGFHQMDFSMAIRWGGYRPMVFMLTGLAVAMFVLSVNVASIANSRAGMLKKRWALFLTFILVICKSTGAIFYAMIVLPMMLFFRRPGVRLAVFLSVLVIGFPVFRAGDLLPTDDIVEFFEKYTNEERALSLWFRFHNEDMLLERLRERPWFGWGGYGRNRVWDPETGEDLSVTDGAWMIDLGMRGVVGFICLYGLLTVPVFLAARRLRRFKDPTDRRLVAALALIVALNATDLLPNGLFNFLPYFYAGVLMGVIQGLKSAEQAASAARRAQHAQSAPARGPQTRAPRTTPAMR